MNKILIKNNKVIILWALFSSHLPRPLFLSIARHWRTCSSNADVADVDVGKPALSTSRSPYPPNLPFYLFIIGCFMRFVYMLHTNILSQIFQRHRLSTDCVCVCYVKNECRTTCNISDQNRMRCRTHRTWHSTYLSPVRYSLHLFKIVEQVLNFVLVHTSWYRA